MANLQQERHVELINGADQAFIVTSTMTAATIPAQLPHLSVFVFTIVDPLDPKRDAFTRVAQIADLTTLPQGRDAALAAVPDATNTFFLSPTCRLSYPSLDEGEAAAQAISDRVNALILSWIDFYTNFNAPSPTPDNISLPTADPAQLQALINAYTAAKEDRYAKGLAVTAADAALARAQAAYTQAQSDVTVFAPFNTTAGQLVTEAQNSSTYLAAALNAGNVFLGDASCAADPDKATFQAALNQTANQGILLAGYLADHTNFAAVLQSFFSGTLQVRQAATQTALTAAQATDITATQQYISAQATEAAALAAVLAVCPDFLSTSVCTVPG